MKKIQLLLQVCDQIIAKEAKEIKKKKKKKTDINMQLSLIQLQLIRIHVCVHIANQLE